MRTNPRQHILETWRAFARVTMDGGEWAWGGRDPSNSISDAEQLLCLLYPAVDVPGFRLGRPDAIEDDVLAVLRPMGSGLDVPVRLVDAIEDYLDRYFDGAGPTFAGGSYLRGESPDGDVKADQAGYESTESYSISISLCLAAKVFLYEFLRTVERRGLRQRVESALAIIDHRLTAAMIGLLRSFVVAVFEPESAAEERLLHMVGQSRSGRTLLHDLRHELQPVRDKLPELTYGLPAENERVLRDYPERFFECGWTWGVAADATAVDLPAAGDAPQRPGVAESHPMLHFTVGTLEALTELFSARTSRQGLLNYDQQALREALYVRWGLTVQYWSTLATFGSGRWPMEDVPWECTDGLASPYYTALVVATVGLRLTTTVGGGTEDIATRCAGVLEELAQRGRVSRRAVPEDTRAGLPDLGIVMPLPGSGRDGPPLVWTHTNYAATLARTALRIAGRTTGRRTRARLTEVADLSVGHLLARRQRVSGLWDDPANVFPGLSPAPAAPDWNDTEGAVEVFVAAAGLILAAAPTVDPEQVDHAAAKIAEARHVLDRELLTATAGGTQVARLLHEVELRLNRAESLLSERPATAAALADRVLVDLDELSSARQSALRSL